MERTRINKKPSAILTSDWHLREDTPICWTGDFQKEQWDSVDFVSDLQKKYDCDVYHTGDLFHHWKPSPWLLRMAIKHLPDQFYTIYGQHDLPSHNLELVDKCGINVLEEAGKIGIVDKTWLVKVKIDTEVMGVHWGQLPDNFVSDGGKNILLWHHLTYITKPFPGAMGGIATGILRKYPQFDLIVTGDNHQSFLEVYQGRLLVNPGCLTRQKADEVNHKPMVYLWYAESNTVIPVYIPIEKGVISREHIEKSEERDARIDAFVSKLNDDWKAKMSFEENLEEFKKANNVEESVMEIVYKSIE